MTLRQYGIIKQQGDDNTILALAFLTLGIKYLHLTSNVLGESIKGGNIHMLAMDCPINNELYSEATRWSDFNIIEPVLFNFYHGLEIIMKGLLFLVNEPDIKPEHGITELLNRLERVEQLPTDIKTILENHIEKTKMGASLLADFLTENQLSLDQLYNALRYPTGTKFQSIHSYIQLHYFEDRALEYFFRIVNDIKKLRLAAVRFYRDLTSPKVMGQANS